MSTNKVLNDAIAALQTAADVIHDGRRSAPSPLVERLTDAATQLEVVVGTPAWRALEPADRGRAALLTDEGWVRWLARPADFGYSTKPAGWYHCDRGGRALTATGLEPANPQFTIDPPTN